MALYAHDRNGGWRTSAARLKLILIVARLLKNARVVGERRVGQIILNNTLGQFEIYNEIANFHGAAANASAIAEADPGPSKQLIHMSLKRVTLLEVRLTPHPLDGVFNHQGCVVLQTEGGEPLPQESVDFLLDDAPSILKEGRTDYL
jgi:hypothetical protein